MQYKVIYKIIDLFRAHQVEHAVISPGSRSAPLTISIARNPGLRKFIIPDERAAGYIAMGISISTHHPVLTVCTSGTAVYNLGPAATEAFYQQVPLIMLTADRPGEWIDQGDGQSIHQDNIFGQNVKRSFSIPVDLENPDSEWHAIRIISAAVNEATTYPAGPVHINFPFREPLYDENEISTDDSPSKIIRKFPVDFQISKPVSDEISDIVKSASRILIVVGQLNLPEETTEKIKKILSKRNIPVLCDVIANLNGLPSPFIYRHDLFLGNLTREQEEKLQPDLLITFGLPVLSKNLKSFLRKNKPRYHFHIQPAGDIPDTFQSLTHIVPMDPARFFDNFTETFEATSLIPSYSEAWQKPENETKNITDKIETRDQLTVIGAVRMILNTIPSGCNIHIANSLPVRLVNYLGLAQSDIRVFANRGTSGIDGCTSTAIGVSLTSAKMNVLITGDMAFFYDRNALWHNSIPENLKIIILNNHGGGIFRMIDGPGKLPELKEYFETDQKLNAAQTARDFGATYFSVQDYESLKKTLPSFFRHSGSLAILEVETDSETDKKIFIELKNVIRKIWN